MEATNLATCVVLQGGRLRCWGNIYGERIGDDEVPSSRGDLFEEEAVRDVGVGYSHVCALMEKNRTVRCWGEGTFGRLGYGNGDAFVHPEDARDVDVGGSVRALCVGGYHTCVILEGGRLRCWGYGGIGILGYGHNDVIGDDETPAEVGVVDVGGQVESVSCGYSMTCVVLVGGSVRCWGTEFGSYALGYGNTQVVGDNETPAEVGDISLGGPAASVSIGRFHICALMMSGDVRCWGTNAAGQLGINSTEAIGDDELPSSIEPVELGLSSPVVALEAGGWHTCVLSLLGKVKCWGHGTLGNLGDGAAVTIGDDETPASSPGVTVGEGVVDLSLGGSHTCLLVGSGRVQCFGYGGGGTLGTGNIEGLESPVLAEQNTAAMLKSASGALLLPPIAMRTSELERFSDGALVVKDVVSGERHSCILLFDSTVRCWGENGKGQLGVGNTDSIGDDEYAVNAKEVDIGGKVVALTAGAFHNCALMENKKVRCWGAAEFGQLGYGNMESIGDDELPYTAGDVDVGGDVIQVDARGDVTCAVLEGGTLRCWGENKYGTLGYLNSTFSNNDFRVGNDETPASKGDIDIGGLVKEVSVGGTHVCALMQVNGSVRCWGRGELNGHLRGNRGIGFFSTPASAGDVDLGEPAVRVIAGGFHSCAVLVSGAVRCWGDKNLVGMYPPPEHHVGEFEPPSAFPTLQFGRQVLELALGMSHSCALLEGGAVRCWGSNGDKNQVGMPSWDSHVFSPAESRDIQLPEEAVRIVAGNHFNCVITVSGHVWCFGWGIHGQLGQGSTVNVITDPHLHGANPLSMSEISYAMLPSELDNTVVDVHDTNGQIPKYIAAPSSALFGAGVGSIDIPGYQGAIPQSFPLVDTTFSITTVSQFDVVSNCPFQVSVVNSFLLCQCPVIPASLATTGTGLPKSSLAILESIPQPAAGGAEVKFAGELTMLAASGGVQNVSVGNLLCSNVRIDQSLRYMTCNRPTGIGSEVKVTVNPLLPSAMEETLDSYVVSYQPPTLTLVSPAETPFDGSALVEVFGFSFGLPAVHGNTANSQALVSVDDQECSDVRVLSDTKITCVVPPGIGAMRTLRVVVGGQEATNTLFLSSLPPSFEWNVHSVIGWRQRGNPSTVLLSWQISMEAFAVLGTEWKVFVEIDEDEREVPEVEVVDATSITTTIPSLVAIPSQRQKYVAMQCRVAAPVHPVHVRVRIGVAETFTSWSSQIEVGASCSDGSFYLDEKSVDRESRTCVPCVEGGRCKNLATSTTLVPSSGYWRLSTKYDGVWKEVDGITFTQCETPEACPGIPSLLDAFVSPMHLVADQHMNWTVVHTMNYTIPSTATHNVTNQCREGHRGIICAACEPGFFKNFVSLCEECGSSLLTGFSIFGLLVLLLILFTCYVAAVVFSIRTSQDDSSKYLQLAISHVQSLAVVLSVVSVRWGLSTQSFIAFLQAIAIPGASQSYQCAVGNNDPAMQAVLEAIVMPIGLILYSALLWLLWDRACAHSRWCFRDNSARKHSWSRKFGVSIVVIASLFHKPITDAGVRLLACVEIQPAEVPDALGAASSYGSLRLAADLDQACENPARNLLAGIFLTMALLLPASVVWVLFSHRHHLTGASRDTSAWLESISFLYEDYRPTLYFWNVVEMCLSVLLVSSTALLGSRGAVTQFLVGIACSATEVLLLSYWRPSTNTSHDSYAIALSYSRVISFLCGALVANVDASPTSGLGTAQSTAAALSILLIIGNILITALGVCRGSRDFFSSTQERCACWGKMTPNRGKELATTAPALVALPRTKSPSRSMRNPMLV